MATVEAMVDDTVEVPVTFEGEGFDAVSSFTLNVEIDQTQLEYVDVSLVEGFPGELERSSAYPRRIRARLGRICAERLAQSVRLRALQRKRSPVRGAVEDGDLPVHRQRALSPW